MRKSLGILLFVGAHGVAAQRAAAPKPITVEGDVYVVTQGGDTKRGAGRTVWLLRDSALADTMQSACLRSLQQRSALTSWLTALADTERLIRSERIKEPDIYAVLNREARIKKGIDAWQVEAHASMIAMMVRNVVDSAGTGINAHYQVQAPGPGVYVLFSEWKIGENHYVWWTPILLRAGNTVVKRDLDNSGIMDAKTLCLGGR